MHVAKIEIAGNVQTPLRCKLFKDAVPRNSLHRIGGLKREWRI